MNEVPLVVIAFISQEFFLTKVILPNIIQSNVVQIITVLTHLSKHRIYFWKDDELHLIVLRTLFLPHFVIQYIIQQSIRESNLKERLSKNESLRHSSPTYALLRGGVLLAQ